MTVGKLIEQLEKLDHRSKVYLATDAEGNNFHNLTEVQGEYHAVVLWPDHSNENPLG